MLQDGVTSGNSVGSVGLAAVAVARRAMAVTRLFAIAGLSVALAACGGGGGSNDDDGGGAVVDGHGDVAASTTAPAWCRAPASVPAVAA
jgi:hypothetical protein